MCFLLQPQGIWLLLADKTAVLKKRTAWSIEGKVLVEKFERNCSKSLVKRAQLALRNLTS